LERYLPEVLTVELYTSHATADLTVARAPSGIFVLIKLHDSP
jgi:hypothetical protein